MNELHFLISTALRLLRRLRLLAMTIPVPLCLLLIFLFASTPQLRAGDYRDAMNSGNTESARQAIDSLITLNGESAELLFDKAQCQLDADSAVHLYRKIYTDYESDPYAAKSLLRLAQYHAVRDELTDVATDVRYLKERFPNSDELHSAEQLLLSAKTTETASNPLEPTPRKTRTTTILGAG